MRHQVMRSLVRDDTSRFSPRCPSSATTSTYTAFLITQERQNQEGPPAKQHRPLRPCNAYDCSQCSPRGPCSFACFPRRQDFQDVTPVQEVHSARPSVRLSPTPGSLRVIPVTGASTKIRRDVPRRSGLMPFTQFFCRQLFSYASSLHCGPGNAR